jgi:hypothetical protein
MYSAEIKVCDAAESNKTDAGAELLLNCRDDSNFLF